MILNRQKNRDIDTKRAARTLKRILKHLHCEGRQVTIVFMDDLSIREFNRKYLSRNRSTNVLSFPLCEGTFSDLDSGDLGDVLISVERAEKDALRSGLPLLEMLDYLMIHGVLHLLGYDHETSPVDACQMKEAEEQLFTLLHHRPISSGIGKRAKKRPVQNRP